MAGDSLGGLVVKISGDMAELKTAMERSTYVSEQAFNKITSAGKVMESALKGMVVGIASSLSVGMFVNMIKGSIDAADHLNDLSKSTGIAVEKLAGLRIAAKQSGGDLDGTAASINKLSVNIGQSGERFAALGVTAKDPLEAFKQLADVFSAIEDPQLRATLGAQALGKSWASAAPLLAEGGAKIGEMVERGERLSGVTKAVTDASDEFNDKLALLVGTGGMMTRTADSLLPLMNSLAGSLVDLQKDTEGANDGFHPLLETMRALVVLGGNVAFVFKGVGTELGGLAAQMAALGSGNFREFSNIRALMVEDAEKARGAFDKWEASVMSVGTATQEAAKKLAAMTQAERDDAAAATAAAKAHSEAAAAKAKAFIEYEARMKSAADALKKWLAEEQRLRELDAKGWVAYIEAREKEDLDALKENERQWDAHWKEMERMRADDLKGAIEAFNALTAETEELLRAQAALVPSMTELYTTAKLSLDQWLAQVKQEASLVGLTNTQREKAILLAERELALKQIEIAIHPDLIAKVNALYEARARLLDMRDAQAELASMSNSLTDALLSAFENGKSGVKAFLDWMKAEFLKTVLRPQIQAFLTPVASAVQSVFGGLSTSLSGSGGLASAFSSFFGSSGVSGYGGAGDPGGFSPADRSLSNNSLAGLFERYFGQGGNVTTALSGIVLGLGVGGAIASALGHGDTHKDATAILSVVGAIVDLYFGGTGMIGGAIGGAVGGIFDSMNEGDIERTARVGQGAGNYTYGSTGGPFGDIGIQRFSDVGFSDTEMAVTLRSWFQAIGKLDREVARHFSGDEISRATAALSGQGMAVSFGLEHTSLDPETLSNIIRTRFGTIFGVIDSQMADLVTNFKGSGEELITLVVDLATVHDRLTALHAEFSTLFGEDITFGDLAALKGETEGYSEALQRLAGEYAVTNQIAQMLGKTQAEVWGAIGLASEGARAHLIELAGGLDALSEQLDYYYTHFYTTAEQQAQTQRTLAQAFADAGVAMPRTIDGFRAVTDRFLGMGEAGAQAAATMLALAPAFYAYIGAIEAVDAAITANGASMVALFGQEVITTEMIAAMQRNGEALTATLARVTSEFAATNDLLAMFGLTSEQVFGAFGLASEAARAKLIELSGGLDKFTTNLSAFYQNYFTQAERNQRSLGSLQGTFAALGLEMPTTLEGFRNLVESQLALGPAGSAAVATLLAIQQQFYDLYKPITDAAGAIGGLTGAASRVVRGPAVDDLGRAAAEAHDNLVRLNDTLRDSFRDAYRSIEMAGMSNQQQYEYLQREAAGYTANLQTAGTGEDVQMWAEKIRADMLAAFSLLDPTEQSARRQEFLDNILQVQEMATARLAALDPTGSLGRGFTEPAAAAAEAQSNAASTQREAATMQKQAAADMQEAAKAMIIANQLIKRIQIDFPTQGVTVEAGA